MIRPTVVVVGLGPAGPDLLTTQSVLTIAATEHRFVRTLRHPAAVAVDDAASFDHLYESAESFDQVYRAIADALVVAAREHGRVLYAVPGSPLVLERSVEYLLADDRVDVEVQPAVSFLDMTWARLGVDPIEAGIRLVDGHTFAVSAAGERGPLLVAHCHNQRVLSDIKLAVEESGDTLVTVLHHLGLPDEAIFTVAWQDLDREVSADHLTSIYIPELNAPIASELMRFQELVQTLRRECPWDREQTHDSLRRHLIEEAYEVLDAIDGFDPATGDGAGELEEELGDLLFQVFLHSVLASEEGWFDLADVARAVHDKLHDRHPHVFGGRAPSDTDELVVAWEQRKVVEKGRSSVLDGVASALPALSLAEKTIKKASAIGSDLGDDRIDQLAEVLAAVSEAPNEVTVGRALFSLAASARSGGVDPEMALRAEVKVVAARIRRYESLLAGPPASNEADAWAASAIE